MTINFKVERNVFVAGTDSAEGFTLGKFSRDGVKIGHTLEDEDRRVEEDPSRKVPGKTAIPRGEYRVILTRSERFSKKAGRDVFLPLLLGVHGYMGVRFHGANWAKELEGCIAVGLRETPTGVSVCAPMVNEIIAALNSDTDVWVEVV